MKPSVQSLKTRHVPWQMTLGAILIIVSIVFMVFGERKESVIDESAEVSESSIFETGTRGLPDEISEIELGE